MCVCVYVCVCVCVCMCASACNKYNCLPVTLVDTELTKHDYFPPGLSRGKVLTPRQQLSNQFSQLLDLQRRSEQLKEKTATMLASRQPGGAVKSGATSFVSPNFSQVRTVQWCISMYCYTAIHTHRHVGSKSHTAYQLCTVRNIRWMRVWRGLTQVQWFPCFLPSNELCSFCMSAVVHHLCLLVSLSFTYCRFCKECRLLSWLAG